MGSLAGQSEGGTVLQLLEGMGRAGKKKKCPRIGMVRGAIPPGKGSKNLEGRGIDGAPRIRVARGETGGRTDKIYRASRREKAWMGKKPST